MTNLSPPLVTRNRIISEFIKLQNAINILLSNLVAKVSGNTASFLLCSILTELNGQMTQIMV